MRGIACIVYAVHDRPRCCFKKTALLGGFFRLRFKYWMNKQVFWSKGRTTSVFLLSACLHASMDRAPNDNSCYQQGNTCYLKANNMCFTLLA